jgi:hypothetical protein
MLFEGAAGAVRADAEQGDAGVRGAPGEERRGLGGEGERGERFAGAISGGAQ